MPEGDTVFVAAKRLHDALAGRCIVRSDFRVPAHALVDLSGQTITGVSPRGKHILMRTDKGVTIHSHLKMDGEWHLYRDGERWRLPSHLARVVIETDEWRAVGFRLGILEVIPTASEGATLAHLGPDLLGPDWDPDEAVRRVTEEATRPIGDALTDQRCMAGLGNVYRNELGFLWGVDPATPVGETRDVPSLVSLAKRVIESNRLRGNQVTTGDLRPGRQQWVYGRGGEPCRRCGTPIKRRVDTIGSIERSTYWCPECQGGARM
ncbi:MAG: DNA-formamidopyrimidine glycosylase family protein [Actinomycetota bacterium]|nr:Fpg/Nei family DNA glycosylase [Actinomycetota bacterium]